jgi:hypothetical protein
MTRPEEALHRSIVQYLAVALPAGWIFHHSRNGGMSKAENGRAKAMGAMAGFPDLVMFGPHAFTAFIEIKTASGRLSPEQRGVHDMLRSMGFPVGIARSLEDVDDLLEEWRVPHLRLSQPGDLA